MEFARRGRPATASVVVDDPALPQGEAMLVIRDALLSQLQKGSLRQKIIMAEVDKIERAVALLRYDTVNGEQAKLVSSSGEEFIPHRMNEGGIELESRTHAMEDCFGERSCSSDGKEGTENATYDEQKLEGSNESIQGEKASSLEKWKLTGITMPVKKPKPPQKRSCSICQVETPSPSHLQEHFAGKKHRSNVETFNSKTTTKPSCDAVKAAGQRNAALDECKLQELNETNLPKKTTPSSVKWSCDICHVEAPTEGDLQHHFTGQKHLSKVAALVSRNNANSQKAKAAAAKSENVRQYGEKPRLTWFCSFCQSNCTCKSNLEDHLRGKRHKAKVQSLLEECKSMAVNCGSLNSQPTLVTQDEDSNPASTWNCSLCQAKCSHQSEFANHLRGKRHQLNFLVLQVEGKQYLSEWGCGICQAKCNSVSQFENHCSSRGHQQKVEALRGGGQIASSSGSSTAKGASSEETEIPMTTYVCKLCDLRCNSKNTLAEHRRGKKHTEKVEKRMSLSFCEVCNLQCNSEKMLAHHRTGKAHLAKVNSC